MTVIGTSESLREVRLPQGVIRYWDVGDGPVLVFVHGILVNGMLWRDVVERLQVQYRCIVPDLPLGSHSVPMGGGVDLTPKGVARIVTDLIEALGLESVTLIGNDTGGAICQIVISENPQNISRLVLTNCDAYEAFFRQFLDSFSMRHGSSEDDSWLSLPGCCNSVSRNARFYGQSPSAIMTQRLLMPTCGL